MGEDDDEIRMNPKEKKELALTEIVLIVLAILGLGAIFLFWG